MLTETLPCHPCIFYMAVVVDKHFQKIPVCYVKVIIAFPFIQRIYKCHIFIYIYAANTHTYIFLWAFIHRSFFYYSRSFGVTDKSFINQRCIIKCRKQLTAVT